MKPRFLAGIIALCVATGALQATDSARVPFPADYATSFTVVRRANKTGQTLLGTIYANPAAAGVTDLAGLPYPTGAVLVMEWAKPLRDEKGGLIVDEAGLWRKGDVVRVDVMQHGPGYGESYGAKRSGEWEFATYNPDTTLRIAPGAAQSCAACHRQAGAARDFVFRGRFPKIEDAPE
jgi:hypothetical protein